MARLLSEYYEKFSKLYQKQIRAWKQWYAIGVIALLIYKIEESWVEKKLAAELFINVKRAFNHLSKTKLVKKIMELGIDSDLI